MAGKKSDTPTPILDYKYQEKRKNIPTHELRDFVADLEKTPKEILYPRDLSLDPQLVWKGKDEQDREDLAVPAVPVYIQEKILPRPSLRKCGRRTGRIGQSPRRPYSPTSTASTLRIWWTSTAMSRTGATA